MFLAPELSAPGLIAKAGAAAKGISAGKTLIGKAAQIASQGAVEGGLMGASHAINERLMGDPNATAEHMLGTIGLSSALGGGLSLALAPVARGVGKLLGDSELLAPKTFEDVLHGDKESVIPALTKLKGNVSEIDAAAARSGVEATPGMRSENATVQNIESRLSKAPTTPGLQVQKDLKTVFDASAQNVDQALGTYSELSKAEVGNELKKGIIDKFKLEEEPVAALYERLKTGVAAEREAGSGVQFQFGYQDIPISENQTRSILSNLKKLERADIPGETRNFITTLEQELPQIKDLQQLKAYRTELNDRLRGKPEFRYALGEVQKSLANLEENSIIRMAEKTAPPESPLHQEIKALIDNRKAANKGYAQLVEKMKDLGSIVGKKLRRGEGPGAFLEWLGDAPPEQIAQKLFTKNNSEFLESFAKEFPDQANVLRTYQKNVIRQNAIKDGKILPNNVLREVDKLEPEIQKFLFSPDEIQKIKDAKTLMEAIPKNVNPSGTAETVNLFEWLKHPLATATAHAADYAQLQIIKNAVGRFGSPSERKAAESLIRVKATAIKTARAIDKHAGSLFGRAVETTTHEHPKRGQSRDTGMEKEPLKLNRIGTMVLNSASNPELLMDHLEKSMAGIQGDAPETSIALSSAISRGVGFLASKAPDQGKAAPLDPPKVLTEPEIAKFNRYAHMVDNPVSILEHVKHGTLLPQDIEAVSTVYPALYSQMKMAVFDKLTNAVAKGPVSSIPYSTKMSLSMFLGQPLDSTMNQQAIQMNQAALAPQAPPQQMASNTKPSKSGMAKYNANKDATSAQVAASRRADS